MKGTAVWPWLEAATYRTGPSPSRSLCIEWTECWSMQGLSYEEATSNFWVLDAEGLVTVKREKQLSESVEPFARKTQADPEGEKLADTVKRVRLLCLT